MPGAGKGVASPPDIDARAYLVSMKGLRPMTAQTPTKVGALPGTPRSASPK
jgi:hypothetical protein